MTTTTAVRTIDMGAWRDGDAAAKQAVVDAFDDSMRHAGFVMVVNHGIAPARAASTRAAALEFFGLAEEVKEPYRAEGIGTRGWLPYGTESLSYLSGGEAPPDMKETYICTPSDLPVYGERALPAIWPDDVMPSLRETSVAFMGEVDALHREVLEIAATAIGLEDTSFFADRAGAESQMSINWYPPMAKLGTPTEGQWRSGPHADFGTITVLDRQPGAGGLQVQLEDGSWVDAPWEEGCLLVNCADVLSMWSNGRWRSAPHRVLPPQDVAPDESLVSLIWFAETAWAVEVAPLEGIDAPDAFEPFSVGEFTLEKIRQITVG
jgi:isopenicillin N synthase-like dioxygenase